MDSSLITALCKPDAYPHPVDRVERLETHISWVLLAGEFAYKIKKPLDLGFLDFSTLEQRKFYCHEEIRLNRRHAPNLYLDVAAITRSGERYRIDSDSDAQAEAVEFSVRMRRFDTDDGFDHLLDEGRLPRCRILELGEQLAQLHQRAEIADPDSRFGSTDQVAQPMFDNFDALRQLLGSKAGGVEDHDPEHAPASSDEATDSATIGTRLDRLRGWTQQQLDALRELLDRRRREGAIRECHGDAHLGNVTLVEGKTTLFDCIEFSEDLRWIDTMNDLAFTVMDLRDRDAQGFGWLLLDRYLSLYDDFEGLRLLNLYMSYRALVRAKVAGLRVDDDLDPSQRRQCLDVVSGYLALAERIAGEKRPAIVITTGFSGSGKSHVASRLLERCGLIRLRSDVERKRLHGLRPEQQSHSGLASDLYGSEATEQTYQRLEHLAGQIAGAGLPVLVDAAFLMKSQRERFRQLARRHDLPFRIISMEASREVLEQRIRKRTELGGDASEADLEVLSHQIDTFEAVDDDYDANDAHDRQARDIEILHLDTSRDDACETAARWLAGAGICQ